MPYFCGRKFECAKKKGQYCCLYCAEQGCSERCTKRDCSFIVIKKTLADVEVGNYVISVRNIADSYLEGEINQVTEVINNSFFIVHHHYGRLEWTKNSQRDFRLLDEHDKGTCKVCKNTCKSKEPCPFIESVI